MHIHSHFMSSSPLQALLFFLVAMWLSMFQLHSEKTVMLHQSESNLPHCTLKSLKFTQLFIRPKLEISGQGTTSKGLVTWGDQSGSCQIGLEKKNKKRKIMGKKYVMMVDQQKLSFKRKKHTNCGMQQQKPCSANPSARDPPHHLRPQTPSHHPMLM